MDNITVKKAKDTFEIINLPTGPVCLGGGIHAAMVAITKSIDAVGKSKESGQGYKYRPVDEFMNALNAAMTKANVSVRPVSVKDIRDEVFKYSKGTYKGDSKGEGLKHVVCVNVTYMFQHSDGSFILAESRGTGVDSNDKASNKALAFAYKYMIMQTFVVPTRDMQEGDATSETPPPPNAIDVATSQTIAEYATWLDQCENAKALTEFYTSLFEQSDAVKKALKAKLTAKATSLKCKYDKGTNTYVNG